MPIHLQHPIQQIPEKDFHELDYEVMRMAFATHSTLGRFYDERIYQTELERQCRTAGIAITKEFEIKLIHNGFKKPLFIDLLINRSSVYELKATQAIAEPNRMQTLNYLFATNTQHGKLINFRPKSVQHEFVSTQLDTDKRHAIKIVDKCWVKTNQSDNLRALTTDLLKDWGAFFDTDIYFDAICHLLGGKDSILRNIDITNKNTLLGRQKAPHLSDSEIFSLTSVTKNIDAYQNHLIRFLKHTSVDSIHWINFNRSTINFTTLTRKLFCP